MLQCPMKAWGSGNTRLVKPILLMFSTLLIHVTVHFADSEAVSFSILVVNSGAVHHILLGVPNKNVFFVFS